MKQKSTAVWETIGNLFILVGKLLLVALFTVTCILESLLHLINTLLDNLLNSHEH
jgi:hypothetical protein